jgi:hypothetical protein
MGVWPRGRSMVLRECVMPKLVCSACQAEQPAPRHCGQPMQVGEVEGTLMLVCWMGPGCGKQPLPEHCERPMTLLT